mmetsp:Transcript_5462/g.10235  ORF Transcript_5462/g.10235 Transcript_5462/m.10235 type:complete len:356 (+) Transcript_5462:61-1128(+)
MYYPLPKLFLGLALFFVLIQQSLSARVADTLDLTAHKKNPYKSPSGLFIQERASKQLPGPGQHFSFGALVNWEEVHNVLDSNPSSKLLILIRHGEAYSNWLENYMGPDEWFKVETTCSYDDPKSGKTYGVFDAELTNLGHSEAKALNSMFRSGGWFQTLTQNKTTRVITSPLSRCLQTTLDVFDDVATSDGDALRMDVEESIRETLGEDTCDSRRSASDPGSKAGVAPGPCSFKEGLTTRFPQFQFPVVGKLPRGKEKETLEGEASLGEGLGSKPAFGLITDGDELWTTTRESQKHQLRRASDFLDKVFRFASEKVIFVITHSGTTRSVLLTVGREPYRPQNTEVVPVIVQKKLI